MATNRVPRSVTILSSIAVFLAAASWAHLSARAQVSGPTLTRPLTLTSPRLPTAPVLFALPMVRVDGPFTAGSSLTIKTRNMGATANGRRVKMVKTVNGAAIYLTVSAWAADRVTVSVPAQPFGPLGGPLPVLVGIVDSGSRWVATPARTAVYPGAASRSVGTRPAGCSVTDFDGDGNNAIECGGSDCDDADPFRYAGASEVCDSLNHDEDCDATTFGQRDSDGDGTVDAACCNVDSVGGRTCGSDCDDYQRGVHVTAPEVCDGRDNDCDTGVDEGVQHILWTDADGDGFGSPAAARYACSWAPGLSYVPNDCNDGDRHVFMGHGCE